jgi:hypothetical protein
LLVAEQGIRRCAAQNTDEGIGFAVGLRVEAALRSAELGLDYSAAAHKAWVEALLAREPDWAGAFPALTPEDLQTYDAIPTLGSQRRR